MSNALEINNLCFSYDLEPILNNLHLVIPENTFCAIVGENGAGKSTLLHLILGNLKYSRGEIRIFGDLIEKDNHYQDIAFISQHSVLGYKNFPTTIEETVKVHIRHLKVRQDASYFLDKVGLYKHRKKTLSSLSGGQLQRLGVLLALIKDARIIILDEPTTGIDVKFSCELFEMLKDLAKTKTVIMVTHQLSEALPYLDRVYEIKEGEIKDYV
ncbi:hypothetical protein HMPREF9943_01396 [Eggerthia catenaformis OT 569 = DSM 20559]|uniref:ABC transporter domain-containing protein n=1 Tax=Eggerthia catenaformis OT 569 = DSM 20559 TaxID=999415 RepID=M2Q014_9FIRM|nr:ATP-binding cassette domain-containing protein [Eggerthia catenaformis]EMD16275.1 hypothetical protein HMPREF9943_01396 [Eggerthia catenaformis OT 569 = DSM 20559]